MSTQNKCDCVLVTAGSTYMDIDAYACSIAMAECLSLKGVHAVAYSAAPCNYSVCRSLVEEGQIARELPEGVTADTAEYVIVDVSDPDYIKEAVPLARIRAVYDHHVGFEEYWASRLGKDAHIEFIGAAATLMYREWIASALQDRMKPSTARLLVAAILDNTLNLTASNTTSEDVEAFKALCARGGVDEAWCAGYFSEVQSSVEADLKNALLNDIKTLHEPTVLPQKIAQLCVWDACRLLERTADIRRWLDEIADSWMLNVIDIKHNCSYFVCNQEPYQRKLEKVFDIRFESGVAKTATSYLRKQIIKQSVYKEKTGG